MAIALPTDGDIQRAESQRRSTLLSRVARGAACALAFMLHSFTLICCTRSKEHVFA